MPNRRLTQDLVDALEPASSVREVRATQLRGFGVRIMPSGRKSWFVHAQHDKRRKWTNLGDASKMRLAKARTLARACLATLRNRNQSRPPDTSTEIPFEDVADAAFRRHARLWKPGTMRVNRHYLKNQILPHFAERPVAVITADDVRQWFASLRPTPATADRSLPVLVHDHAGGREARLSPGGQQPLPQRETAPARRPRPLPVPGGGPSPRQGAGES